MRGALTAFTGLLVTLVFIWVLAFGLLTMLKPQLADMILFNTMRAKISYDEAKLDVFSDFPNLRVELVNATFHSTNPWLPEIQPFRIKRAFLELDLDRIVQFKRKHIPFIGFEGVAAHMVVDTNMINCHAFFPHYDPQRRMPDHTRINELNFKNAVMLYDNRAGGRGYEYRIDSVSTSIDIFPHYVNFDPIIVAELKYMFEEDLRFLEQMPIRINSQFTLIKEARAIDIHSLDLLFAGNRFFVQGRFPASQDVYYNLTFQAPDGDVEAILKLLPEESAEKIRDFKPSGQFAFSGILEGRDTDTTNPNFELEFITEDGALNASVFGAKLSNLDMKGSFSNGEQNSANTTKIKLQEIQGNLNSRPFYATMALSRLDNPYVRTTLDASVNLRDMPSVQQIPLRKRPQGLVSVDLAFAGMIDDLKQRKTIDELDITGEIRLDSVALSPKQLPIEIRNATGKIVLADSSARIDSLKLTVNGQDLMVSATFDKLFRYIAGSTELLQLDTDIALYDFSIDQLLATMDTLPVVKSAKLDLPAQNKQMKPEQLVGVLLKELPKNMDIGLKLKGTNVSYQGIAFKRVIADAELKDQLLDINELSFSRLKDALVVRGQFNTAKPEVNTYEGAIDVYSDDLVRLLRDINPKMAEPLDTLLDQKVDFGINMAFKGQARRPTKTLEATAAKLQFDIVNGYVRLPKDDLEVSDLRASAHFDQDIILQPKTTPIGIDSLRLKLNGNPVRARVLMRDLKTKELAIELSSRMKLQTLMKLLPLKGLEDPAGELAFDTELYGKLDDLTNPDSLLYIRSVGSLTTYGLGATFATKKLRVQNVNGSIDYDEDDTMINYLKGDIGSSDFRISGIAQELLPFVFDQTKPLQADITFRSDRLILQELLSRNVENPDSGISFGIPFVGDVVLDAKVKHVEYDKFVADNLKMLGEIHGKRLKIDKLVTDFAGGHIDAFGRLNAENPDSIITKLDIDIDQVSIPQVLKTFDNFGQTLITHDSTEGIISARITFLDALPQDLVPTFERTRAEGNIVIDGGLLTNFEPFYVLQPFIRKEDMQYVKYNMAVTNITLVDSQIIVPEVDFNSSIFHVIADGKATVDGMLDFYLKVQPHQQRARILQPRLIELITGAPPERSIINLVVVGDASDPKIKYDWDRSSKNLLKRFVY